MAHTASVRSAVRAVGTSSRTDSLAAGSSGRTSVASASLHPFRGSAAPLVPRRTARRRTIVVRAAADEEVGTYFVLYFRIILSIINFY